MRPQCYGSTVLQTAVRNKSPELHIRTSLTEAGTRRMELVRAWGKALSQRLTVEQLTPNEQESGSSPLVGSLLF